MREGWDVDELDGSTALVCAETGGLLDELRADAPDDDVLRGAGAILRALVAGEGQTGADDEVAFHHAVRAADALGVDAWPAAVQRLDRPGADRLACWTGICATDDPARVRRAVDLALDRLDLDRVATGPMDWRGHGSEFVEHACLERVLALLRHHPGLGWPLLRAGLASPVTSNRRHELAALGSWGRGRRDEDVDACLRRAIAVEPDDAVRARTERVLAGEIVDDDD